MSESQAVETPSGDEDAAREAELSLLRTENERLRRELERSTRTTYRRTALALLVVGLASALAGLVLPAARTVLVVVGSIGVFSGILTWYLTPERVLSASVVASAYDAHAETLTALQSELGLRAAHVYLPDEERVGGAALFLPRHADYDVPEATDRLFVTTGTETARGVVIQPTAAILARSLDQSLGGDLGPGRLPTVLSDAIVEQFELVTDATAEREGDTLTIEVDGLAIDGLERPDHPVVSLCAVATTQAVDGAVQVESVSESDGRVTITW
ncbi:hypothetical protein [Haloarchaeobius iranensis]|uniref:DUF7982 domain-containing protein n=1 Tax=Haloarchaeobius iranensis TaxID=996166 RepID=A0A1H0AEM1_9EURY|nr:hypothetical protein [Haloarchaeobius iranensis]SDN31774.1 hypothetical protein SAMN05192554_12650 [Haloarchaeobius iranensis]